MKSAKNVPAFLKLQEVLYETYQTVQIDFPFTRAKKSSPSNTIPFRFDDTPLFKSVEFDRSIRLKPITNGSNFASTEKL